MPREGPVPAAWVKYGAPPEPLAAYAEGMCPVHRIPLDEGMFRTGGKGTMPLKWIPGGWCDACAAWWSRLYNHSPADALIEALNGPGLVATWGPGYGPDS